MRCTFLSGTNIAPLLSFSLSTFYFSSFSFLSSASRSICPCSCALFTYHKYSINFLKAGLNSSGLLACTLESSEVCEASSMPSPIFMLMVIFSCDLTRSSLGARQRLFTKCSAKTEMEETRCSSFRRARKKAMSSGLVHMHYSQSEAKSEQR